MTVPTSRLSGHSLAVEPGRHRQSADLATQRRPAGSILSPGEGDRRPLPTAMYEGQGTKRGRKSKIEIESKRVRKEERERESEGEEGECHYSTV